jgi:soluble lytic murein transglycosylase-like protein
MKHTSIALLVIILSLLPKITVKATDDTWLTPEIQQECISIGNEYNICPELLMAIIESESWGIADVSNGNCKGLMQINEKFHKDRMSKLNVSDLFSPHDNILTGTDYLRELFGKYDTAEVIICYNMGENKAKKLFARGIYETAYSRKILERSAELERLHGK